ncbi:hypothetical protein [Mycolicibacterium aubagnense]|uniref:Uncharacterized protein n=1 Tax=Mycolicibacterium aubagnense TaxID=319707 RepID=A0ABN5Z4H0_9MYCO|nr:hypothetical protein [Mycolicibacterium aubagnense]TLH64240.1 hypothetical protein C1S80_12565 [Mycolicibacterium aubagnense]BBX87879.1 hypothetical protein MAUB_57520 [Mycolicibacterium aubagnense]
MRSFRVFNDVTGVRTVWKLGGIRLGAFAQIAMLSTMAISAALVLPAGPVVAAAVFTVSFLTIAIYATVLSRIDETGTLSEITALRLLRRGLRHRVSANFDLPGVSGKSRKDT